MVYQEFYEKILNRVNETCRLDVSSTKNRYNIPSPMTLRHSSLNGTQCNGH